MRTMSSRYWLFTPIFAAASLLHIAEAEAITGVTIDPSTARIASADGVSVKITIHADADAPKFCGLRIEYGGSIPAQDIKIDNSEGLFPRVVTQKFTKPDTYTIRVHGKKVTTHLPCPGKASAVFVLAPAESTPKPPPIAAAMENPRKAAPGEKKFFESWF